MIFGYKNHGALGDCLYITAALNVLPGSTVQMHNDDQCRFVARVFDGLASVEFIDNPNLPIYCNGDKNTHAAQRTLDILNIKNTNCIPKIKLTQEEISWGNSFISLYKNPVCVVNDNGGSGDINNTCAQYKRPPIPLMQFVVDYLNSIGHTVLQFGRNDHPNFPNCFTPLNNTIPIRGLSVRELASCYHSIGKYVGGDTGDYHLMLSVGGKCIVFVPPNNKNLGFSYNELFYKDYLWKDEAVRVKYIDYTVKSNITELLRFSF